MGALFGRWPSPVINEQNLGPFDGVQTQFSTNVDYAPGTLRVFTPLLEESLNAVELGGKDFSLPEAPISGDVLFYVYRSLLGNG